MTERRGTEEGRSQSSGSVVASPSRASVGGCLSHFSVGLGWPSPAAGPTEDWEPAVGGGLGRHGHAPDRFPGPLGKICGPPSSPPVPALGPLRRWELSFGGAALALGRIKFKKDMKPYWLWVLFPQSPASAASYRVGDGLLLLSGYSRK